MQPVCRSISRKEGSYGFPLWRPGKDGTDCLGAVHLGAGSGEASRTHHAVWLQDWMQTRLKSQTCLSKGGRVCPLI